MMKRPLLDKTLKDSDRIGNRSSMLDVALLPVLLEGATDGSLMRQKFWER
jgi:hypothetical protein